VAAPCPASQAQRLRPGRRGSRACPQHRNGAPKDRIHSSGGSRPPGNRPEPLPSAGGHPLGVPIPNSDLGTDVKVGDIPVEVRTRSHGGHQRDGFRIPESKRNHSDRVIWVEWRRDRAQCRLIGWNSLDDAVAELGELVFKKQRSMAEWS